jgi:hypothetical protein
VPLVSSYTMQIADSLPRPQRKAGGVDIALDAAELEGLSEADLRMRYEEAGRRGTQTEDFSDFVGKEVAKRRKTGEFLLFVSLSFSPSADWISPAPSSAEKKKDNKEKEKFKF